MDHVEFHGRLLALDPGRSDSGDCGDPVLHPHTRGPLPLAPLEAQASAGREHYLSRHLGRFARSLSVTLRSGVPLVQGMTVVSRAVDNDFIGQRILQMRDGIERGETIARTAAATGLFPPWCCR